MVDQRVARFSGNRLEVWLAEYGSRGFAVEDMRLNRYPFGCCIEAYSKGQSLRAWGLRDKLPRKRCDFGWLNFHGSLPDTMWQMRAASRRQATVYKDEALLCV